jgi:nitrate reductase alpha subunit
VASVKQGTDAALAMALGHVILKEFHVDRQDAVLPDYVRKYTDMPMLVRLVPQDGTAYVPERCCAPPTSTARWAKPTIPTGRPSPRRATGKIVVPRGSIGFRWGETANGIWRRRRQGGGD